MNKIGFVKGFGRFGTVLKLDNFTLRLVGNLVETVDMDLQNPLLSYVEVEGVTGVVYEGISVICFSCGWYGHVNCPY